MLFRVLGAVDVVRSDGARIPVEASKPRALLATLLLHAGEWVSVERLVDALWPGDPPASAGQNVKTYVWKLRRSLAERPTDERIAGGRGGYRILVADDELDARRFEELVRAGRRHGEAGRHRQAAAALSDAVGLWRGEPFGDLVGPDVESVRAGLAERLLTAQEGHAAALSALGAHEEAVVALTGLVARHPFRERLRGALMTALYRAGRQAEALDVYDEGRVLLDRELGLRPGEELRRLHLDVLNQNLPVDREPPRWTSPAQVPAAVVGFTGRGAHLDRLDALLTRADDRQPPPIAVVTGTGGVGKSALVVHWAHRVRHRFPDGQLHVNLRGYDPELPVGPGDALSGFLRALGVDSHDIPQDVAERSARFRSLLAGRRVLVVLDNARTAAQVRPLLPGSPGCLVLVTSRDSLRGLVATEGATRLPLDLLPADEARDLLCALIGDRARADLRAVDALAGSCARLPLALRLAAELATGRPTASLADLGGELTREHDRLDRLDDDGDPHAALRSAFSWSYRQLAPATARVFRLLGAHPCQELGVAAIGALTGVDARRHVEALVRAHLVERTADDRFQMHDLLRAYARGLAAELDDVAERDAALHALADHYVREAAVAMRLFDPAGPGRPVEESAAGLTTRDDAMAWLESERANLLAVAEHAAAHGDAAHAEELAATLWHYFHVRGHHDESLALHTHALVAARRRADRVAEGVALTGLGVGCERLGRYEEALRHHEQAVVLGRETGDANSTGRALKNLGVVLRRLGRLEEARRAFEEALVIARDLGNRRGEAGVLISLALLHQAAGRHEEVIRGMELALAAVPDVDNDHALVDHAQANLGLAHLRLGRVEVARKHLGEALASAQATGNRDLESEVQDSLGELAGAEGDHERAVDHHHRALALTRRAGDRQEEARAHAGLARAYDALGRPEDAHRHRLLAARRAPGAR